MKHNNTVSRENSRYFKPLVKSHAVGVSAWAGADKWAVVGYDEPIISTLSG